MLLTVFKKLYSQLTISYLIQHLKILLVHISMKNMKKKHVVCLHFSFFSISGSFGLLGDGPALREMFTGDYNFQNLIEDCSKSLDSGFNAAKIYADTFDEFHQFYVENENTNIDALKTEPHGTLFLEN